MSSVNFKTMTAEAKVQFLLRRSNNDMQLFLNQVKPLIVHQKYRNEIDKLLNEFLAGNISYAEAANKASEILKKDMEEQDLASQDIPVDDEKSKIFQDFFDQSQTSDIVAPEQKSETEIHEKKQEPTIKYTPNDQYLIPLFHTKSMINFKLIRSQEVSDSEVEKIPTDPAKFPEFIKKKKDFIEKAEQIGKSLQELEKLQKS